jgi:NTP pyrophosphatase (non-canonical NTP hydrolase)
VIKVRTDLVEITDDIMEWLEDVYPDRHPDQVWEKLMEEIEEWKSRPTDAWEVADVMILILDLCKCYGIDVSRAIHFKMDRNRKREWEMKNGKLYHK